MRRYRVLFVCIGNACRSQMAEGFAHAYGSDVFVACSAGLNPCEMISPTTANLMEEKGISLNDAYPKGIAADKLAGFDLIVNMSGHEFPYQTATPVREWHVDDPVWFPEARHREVRDQIEVLVQRLILEFRNRRPGR